ncbi:low-specificity L-threonine aldolase [Virgibacillus necropolis]|uniref:Low-specificity L-threonine aldolase n=1 Tax=Virgibacillus necropolis TaxID=163877 RepID=A0A221MAZ3_9BACI|nr:low-specificity L-threonine aldolase [Virgibacillus necropolis]ASN04799.1 low-specificity L-threonine aldolase [Virgibacillus necropolis]
MIDLRSDTVTKPTPEMRQAAFDAVVGDDVYNEDPTLKELEELAANKLGKEAALFVPSGTQGNQIAVLTHCQSGQEIILEAESHIFYYEGASISAFAGVQPRTINGTRGAMDPELVKAAIREDDIHLPETGLICLENTHNRAGGAIVSLENMKEIHRIAQENNIPVHLDGARLFNAAVASEVDVKTYAAQTDTVQFCLSKGLGAPVGSIIAGSEDFIKKARKWRKRLGGGLRQAGIIAAPGIVALKTMVDRLVEDHENAKFLASGLQEIKGLSIENNVDTNIILVNTKEAGLSSKEFLIKLKQEGILGVSFGPNTVRFTTHFDVTREEIKSVMEKVNKLF